MSSLYLLALSSFLVSLLLTPLCRDLFLSLGVVDRPDGGRKFHKKPVARMGGVAIALAYAAAYLIFWFSPLSGQVAGSASLAAVLRVVPAGLLIFVTGLLDDLFDLKPIQKLAGQATAAGWAYWAGVRIPSPDGHSAIWWSLPVTLFWLVACANAINFIDGIDGLAAGLGLLATVTILVAAVLEHNTYLVLACVPLAGSLLGFLFFNFPPASIFLGDSGSLTIGFLLGCYGIVWAQQLASAQQAASALAMAAPIMTLAVPIADMCLSVTRRTIRNKPIFGADRGHIHHKLLDRGLSPRGVVLVLYGVTAVGAILSLILSAAPGNDTRIVIVLFCVLAVIGVRRLNYLEFNTAHQILMKGDFVRLVDAQLFLRGFQHTLAAVRTAEEWRDAVESACRELGFCRVEIGIGGELSQLRIAPEGSRGQYHAQVPLSGQDYVNLTRDFFCEVHPAILTSFIDTLRSHSIPRRAPVLTGKSAREKQSVLSST